MGIIRNPEGLVDRARRGWAETEPGLLDQVIMAVCLLGGGLAGGGLVLVSVATDWPHWWAAGAYTWWAGWPGGAATLVGMALGGLVGLRLVIARMRAWKAHERARR
jgi:hypothetical protein